ncbi:MAG: hypothetical protein GXP62_10740, partial [Oligoflexia bacterium]|nr:hypothetical protein [Oligoflexia bacterium]
MADRAADLLSRYAAQSVRLSSGGSARGAGGGLAAAIDRLGVQPLALVLLDGETVELGDPGVSLQVRREGPGDAVMRVSWDQGPTYEEHLAVPAASAEAPSAEAPAAAPQAAQTPVPGTRVDDLGSALRELERPLWVDESGVYRDGPGPGSLCAFIPAMTTQDL